MGYSYSGDPAASDLDYYRFLTGDTGILDDTGIEPVTSYILSDEEIGFVVTKYKYENTILYKLYESITNLLSRNYKNGLGPAYEDPTSMLNHYRSKVEEYKKYATLTAGLSQPAYSMDKIFRKGMHDND
jgi:hypothetical protein